MKTSDRGIQLIKDYEGFSPIPYRCPAGRNTIGYGHCIRTGEIFHTIDETTADQILRDDAEDAEAAISQLISAPLSQNQFDALVSFTFNLGAQRLEQSTLRKMLNRKDYSGAAKQFERWVYAGTATLPGLKKRRTAERNLFEMA